MPILKYPFHNCIKSYWNWHNNNNDNNNREQKKKCQMKIFQQEVCSWIFLE